MCALARPSRIQGRPEGHVTRTNTLLPTSRPPPRCVLNIKGLFLKVFPCECTGQRNPLLANVASRAGPALAVVYITSTDGGSESTTTPGAAIALLSLHRRINAALLRDSQRRTLAATDFTEVPELSPQTCDANCIAESTSWWRTAHSIHIPMQVRGAFGIQAGA